MKKRFRFFIPWSLMGALALLGVRSALADASLHSALPCEVGSVTLDKAYLGVGFPHLEEIRAKTKDEEAIQRYAHSGHHLSCYYRVRINGKPYQYYAESQGSEGQDAEKACGAKLPQIRESVLSIIRRCAHLGPLKGYGYFFQAVEN